MTVSVLTSLAVTVRDPVCGMKIKPDQAIDTRTIKGQTFYFCCKRCVEQFDREHTASATTGVAEGPGHRHIDLPIHNLDGQQGAYRLVEHLARLPGVIVVKTNFKTGLAHVVYNTEQVSIRQIMAEAGTAGYITGYSTMHLTIQGMHCGSCVVAIEEALAHTPGVLSATVNLTTSQACVEYMIGLVDTAGLTRAIENVGYKVGQFPAVSNAAPD